MAKKQLNFEEKMDRLSQIVCEIESGNLSLDDSLKLYEEANVLIKELKETIEKAKEKVSKVEN